MKTETLNIEKYDEPIDKRILQLILGLRISKLVIGITFLKSSSLYVDFNIFDFGVLQRKNACLLMCLSMFLLCARKYGSLLNGLKRIQRKKPDFCDIYLTSGGKLFFLKEENNEGFIEDDQGEMVAKLNKKRGSFKGWIGKMFPENAYSPQTSPSSSTSTDSPPIWEKCAEQIEEYFNHLLEPNADEESASVQVSHDISEISRSTEPDIPKNLVSSHRFIATITNTNDNY